MKRIHIAVGSTMSRPGDVDGNLRQIERFAEKAGEVGADILLTPELSAAGYGPYPAVLSTAEPAGDGPIYRALAAMARTNGVVIGAGFAEAHTGKTYLSHYVVYPDGHFVVQRKHRVTLAERPLTPGVNLIAPDYQNNPPKDPADPGQPTELRFRFFEVCGVRCAVAICADSGITGVNEHFAANGVELLLLPAGAGGERKDRVTTADLATPQGRELYLKILEMVFFPGRSVLDCIQYRRALAAVNQCGFDGVRMYHLGHGMIITPFGEVPALIHGLPNIDRQHALFTHAIVDVSDALPRDVG